jgi:isoleucyl-tRNA synthetase
VHHTAWPEADSASLDQELLAKMRLAVTVASLGRSARSAANIKLRQPLAQVRVNVASEQERQDILELAEMLAEEINVKQIEVVSEVGELVDYKLLPNNRLLGPKYGADFPKIRRALLELDPAQAVAALQETGQLTLTVDDETIVLDEEEVLVQTESRGGLAVASDRGVTVAVDTELTPELLQEGYARDLVRVVNTMRKDAGLEIEDRITLHYEMPEDPEVAAALRNHGDYIADETLARTLVPELPEEAFYRETVEVGESKFTLALDRVD